MSILKKIDIKSVLYGLGVFAVAYAIISIISSVITSSGKDGISTVVWINVLVFLVWVAAAYFTANMAKKNRIINGLVFGLLTPIVTGLVMLISDGYSSFVEAFYGYRWLYWIMLGVFLGSVGGGISRAQEKLLKRGKEDSAA